MGKAKLPRGPGASTQGESNPGQKGLRDRNSPTLSVTLRAYDVALIPRFGSPKKAGRGLLEQGGRSPMTQSLGSVNRSFLITCLLLSCLSLSLTVLVCVMLLHTSNYNNSTFSGSSWGFCALDLPCATSLRSILLFSSC